MAEFTIAFDSLGNIINIENAKHGEKYTCINCSEQMMAKKGDVREWHFSHHNNTAQCHHDGWLHKEVLSLIISRIEKSNTFKIDTPDGELDLCNNIEYTREKEYEGFTPDILIKTNGDVIFFEVCVTHACSKEKIASGIKIIEIQTSNDKVLEELLDGNIHSHAEYYKLKFYNFDQAEVKAIRENQVNIPDIITPETERKIGNGRAGMKNGEDGVEMIKGNSFPDFSCGNASNARYPSFFILHSDGTYEATGYDASCSTDILVLSINTVPDFALNIGKSYAWRKGLLPKEKLTKYEQHIDIAYVAKSFGIVELVSKNL